LVVGRCYNTATIKGAIFQAIKLDRIAWVGRNPLRAPALRPTLIQAYLDRWEIEVLHRELKSQVGLGQAQVWSDKSVARLHPSLVAAYALLKLAAMKAFGPTRTADYHELPPWRSRRDREGLRRPSANDLLTRLRADLAAQVHAKPPDGQLPPRETYAAAWLFQIIWGGAVPGNVRAVPLAAKVLLVATGSNPQGVNARSWSPHAPRSALYGKGHGTASSTLLRAERWVGAMHRDPDWVGAKPGDQGERSRSHRQEKLEWAEMSKLQTS